LKLASVIVDIPTQALDSLFHYVVPEELEDAEVGCAAVVPFAGRLAIAYIVGIDEAGEDDIAQLGLKPAKLKAIMRIASKPYFDEDGAACALHLAQSCVAPLATCIRLFTPPGGVPRVVKRGGSWEVEQPEVGEVDDRFAILTEEGRNFTPRAGATRQQAIIDALRDGELRVAELATGFGSVSATLESLAKKGVIRLESRRRNRAGGDLGDGASTLSYGHVGLSRPALTEGQDAALAAIGRAVQAHEGRVVLVDGVTGSGKTEVYLRAIEPVLAAGQRVLVLVPEISLTPQTVARFRGRFGDRVAVMHSKMSRGERYDQWDYIRSGGAKVIVGARSALFTPVANLGMVIIDEEHEGSYKQDSAPRYHARDVALWMVRRRGATLVLGSATPSIESLYRCAKDPRWERVVLAERANGKPLPPVEVVDMAAEFRGGSRSMFSGALTRHLRDTLSRGQKAMLLLNQRGFAKFVLCRDCGFVPECPHCATSLTYHDIDRMLICHHCGHAEVMPPRCPKCGSPYLKLFGAGTQRVESELHALIAGFDVGDVRIIRMDADTTRRKGAHRELLEQFMAPGAAVLLGTQMIAKGLDFEDVTLVGVINADTSLKLPDFRSAEQTYDLLEQVAGRAGRADLPGRVVVQTYMADASAVRAAASHDRALFLREEVAKRKALHYPPYARLANIVVWGKDAAKVKAEAEALYARVQQAVADAALDSWRILPATPCVLSKLRGTFRWHIVVKAPADGDIAHIMNDVMRAHKPADGVRSAIDIDPLSMI